MTDQAILDRLTAAEEQLARQQRSSELNRSDHVIPGIPSELDRLAMEQLEERREAERVANVKAAKQREADRPKQEARDRELATLDEEIVQIGDEIRALQARRLDLNAERQALAGRPL